MAVAAMPLNALAEFSGYFQSGIRRILDSSGKRYDTCNDPFDDFPPAGAPVAQDSTPFGYDDPCMNNGTLLAKATGARLNFRVPGASGETTFYFRVFDWRGYARPDMYYQVSITTP